MKEIHLFDGDRFGQHNAFRSPGAPSLDTLRAAPRKSDYFQSIYECLRYGIVAHGHLDGTNAALLQDVDFAFIAADTGRSREIAVTRLQDADVPFVVVGMGINEAGDGLYGQVTVSASTEEKRDHIADLVSFSDREAEDDYSRNIQIADLNALNAALAVIKWKKIVGFYSDIEHEHFCSFQLGSNFVVNDHKTKALM